MMLLPSNPKLYNKSSFTDCPQTISHSRKGQSSWSDAQARCIANGDLRLASVQTDNQFTAAYSVLDGSTDAYIGLNDLAFEVKQKI